MQNFTLGKKGYAMLLFALVLLIGSSPTYGQTSTNCPTVSDTSQDFCYLATIADLEATANNDGVSWYRTATSNTAIPGNELLETRTYYAGNNSRTCTTRIAVSVTIDDFGVPTADFGNTFAPCEYSTTDNSTVQDLISSVVGNDIRIYTEEFSGTALSPSTLLTEGRSYFADQKNPDTDCRTSRLALRYEPVLAEAPTAEPVQVFCPGATVSDLEAQATSANQTAFRWYSTATSNPQLSSNTPLINGETYYASQIVNRENSPLPPCESRDRFLVTVEFQNVEPTPATQVFCVDSDNSSTNPRGADLVSPYNTAFFVDQDFTQLLAPQALLIDGNEYYTGSGDDDICEVTSVTVEFVEIPNAGSDVNEVICRSALPESLPAALLALQDRISSLLDGRDLNGEFTNSTLDELAAQFSLNQIGVFTTTYTVSNGSCTDSANFTVTIQAPTPVEAGNIDNFAVCSNDNSITLSDLLSGNAPRDGKFTNSINEIVTTFNPSASTMIDNTFTYTVNGNSVDCTFGTASESFTITVNQAPNAGENGSIEVSRNDPSFNLFTVLEGDPESDGTFSPGNLDGTFNPATGEQGTYTYTVTNDNCQAQATVNVIILDDNLCPVVPRAEQFFCELIVDQITGLKRKPQIRDLKPAGATWYDSKVETDPERPTATLKQNHVYYAGNAQGTCDNRTRIIVRLLDEPSAGANTTILICEDEEAFDITPRIADSSEFGPANGGGTFSPAFASGTTIFDPSLDSEGVYTYTSSNGVCNPASSEITIQFIDNPIPANAGTISDVTYCSDDSPLDLFSLVSNADGVYQFGEFTVNGDVVINRLDLSSLGGTTLSITYTVSEEQSACISGSNSVTFKLTVNTPVDAEVGPIANQETCVEGDAIILQNLLNVNNTSLGGTFSGTGVNNGIFEPSTAGAGSFTINYNVNESGDLCFKGSASGTFTINVTAEATTATVGTIPNQETCVDGDLISLATLLNSDTTSLNGIFTGTGVSNGIFDPAEAGAGLFTITYNVNGDNNPCLNGNASGTFTINVTAEATTAMVGTIPNQETCVDGDAILLGTLLNADTTSLNGIFTGTGVSNGIFDPATAGAGLFTITYNVNGDNNPCIDVDASGTFTINVTEEATTAMVGTIPNQETCVDGDAISLGALLDADTTSLNGTFTGTGVSNGIFDPATAGAGMFTITYNVNGDNNPCIDGDASGTFTINVTEEATTAIVGTIPNQETCIDGDAISLGALLDADTTNLNGTFTGTGVSNGIFDPAAAGAGLFTITYNVNGDNNPCIDGNASGTFTINVTDLDAPTAEATQSFCLIDNPTVGDIAVTGDNVVFYTDAELTVVADATTTLISGMSYYATSTTEGAACSSEAVEITVTITDPAAPALSLEGDEFCRSDNPTIQDLINNFTGSGVLIYTSSTGGTAITATTALQNGVTYYGASIDGTTGCESSERLAVVAKVEFCGIPEGFSPNGDGINDRFVIPDIAENFPNYSIEVFNRWGNAVFKGNASTGDWDGISNQSGTLGNDVLPVGVYFYILNYNDGQTSPVQGKLYLSI